MVPGIRRPRGRRGRPGAGRDRGRGRRRRRDASGGRPADPAGGRSGRGVSGSSWRRRSASAPDRCVLLLAAAARPRAQERRRGSTAAAEQARRAWFAHDAAGLVADSPGSWSSFPAPIRRPRSEPEQAAALLDRFPRLCAGGGDRGPRGAGGRSPAGAMSSFSGGIGWPGTQEVRVQSLLLGYRKARTGWSLVELRVVEAEVAAPSR